LFIIYVNPIDSPDLFWHLKYGEYLLKSHTLIPAHTLYSWSKADPTWVYCAWLSEIILYLFYKIGGFGLFFVLRYIALSLILGLFLYFSYKTSFKLNTFTLLCIFLLGIGVKHGLYVKPELFSLVFFTVCNFIYFYGKTRGRNLFFLYPLLFLIWVNTHGGFIFGIIFITIVVFIEILNVCCFLKSSKSKSFLFSLLSYAVLFINPYGYRYLTSLYHYATDPIYISHTKAVLAYKTPMSDPIGYILVAMFLIFLSLNIIKLKRLNLGLYLLNAIFFCISMKYGRTTYLYPVIWCFSILYLLSQYTSRIRLYLNRLSLPLLLVLGFWFAYSHIYYPYLGNWFGFGLSYNLPIKETTFIKKYNLRGPIFNTYGIGGYLIWELYPQNKVFIDGRFGPYASLFSEYLRFQSGGDFLNFIRKYKFKIAIVELKFQRLLTNFINSNMWKLVYFDTSSAIFVHKKSFVGIKPELTPERFNEVKNVETLFQIFNIYPRLGDLKSSQYILNLMKKKFNYGRYKRFIKDRSILLEAYKAFEKSEYKEAITNLEYLAKNGSIKDVDLLIKTYLIVATEALDRQEFMQTLMYAERILTIEPSHPIALYYAGLSFYFTQQYNKALWYFQKILSLYPDSALAGRVRKIIRQGF